MDDPENLDSIDQIEKADRVARRTLGLGNSTPGTFSLNVLNLGCCGIEVCDDNGNAV
jgi:hypothetical protein